ncbi:MAG: hypothetical protein B7Z72_12100, partial [Gemmatimonadetes bacterium 21-71-4]
MDAREQLRRYLEQRREMGESELVLDGLSVEEAMRVLGAGPTGPGGSADWRAALQQAGAQPVSPAEPPPALRTAAPDPAPEKAPVKWPPPAGLVVGSSSRDLFGGKAPAFGSLADLAAAVAACTKCGLHKGAKNPVPGEGNPDADFMCVGEAPGATEDETGRP